MQYQHYIKSSLQNLFLDLMIWKESISDYMLSEDESNDMESIDER